MPKWQLTHIRERHFHAAHLLALGLPRSEVCKQTGYDYWHLSKLWNSASFRAVVRSFQATEQEISQLSPQDPLAAEDLRNIRALGLIRDSVTSQAKKLRAATLSMRLINQIRQRQERQAPAEIRLVLNLPPALAAKFDRPDEAPP